MASIFTHHREGTSVVRVHQIRQYRDGIEELNLFAFLEEMREVLDSVPAKHRADVCIDLGKLDDGEGFEEGFVAVYYLRNETEEELAVRRRAEETQLLRRLEWLRKEERDLALQVASLGLGASRSSQDGVEGSCGVA